MQALPAKTLQRQIYTIITLSEAMDIFSRKITPPNFEMKLMAEMGNLALS
jgi:hypothetical protein